MKVWRLLFFAHISASSLATGQGNSEGDKHVSHANQRSKNAVGASDRAGRSLRSGKKKKEHHRSKSKSSSKSKRGSRSKNSRGKRSKNKRGKRSEFSGGCRDPLSAILRTLDCIEMENVECAAKGYDTGSFTKLHNGIDTNTTITSDFWAGAFLLADLFLEYNHAMNIGRNRASVRYVEVVVLTTGEELGLSPSTTYPFGQTFIQHEHALVTVDDRCRMVLWDQYGDNKEQIDVDNAVNEMLKDSGVLCALGVLPPESCI